MKKKLIFSAIFSLILGKCSKVGVQIESGGGEGMNLYFLSGIQMGVLTFLFYYNFLIFLIISDVLPLHSKRTKKGNEFEAHSGISLFKGEPNNNNFSIISLQLTFPIYFFFPNVFTSLSI